MTQALSPERTEILAAGMMGGREIVRTSVTSVPDHRRSAANWPELFVAVLVASDDGDEAECVFATGADADSDFGPIVAINECARVHSIWGEPAHPDSQIEKNRRQLLSYPEVYLARSGLHDHEMIELLLESLEPEPQPA